MYSLRGSLRRWGEISPLPQIPSLLRVDPDPMSEVYSTECEAFQLEEEEKNGKKKPCMFY